MLAYLKEQQEIRLYRIFMESRNRKCFKKALNAK